MTPEQKTLARWGGGLAAALLIGWIVLGMRGARLDELQVIAESLTKPVQAAALRTALLKHLAGVEPRPVHDRRAVPAKNGRRHRILVVEDNPVNQMVALGLLESLGYAADTAEDGIPQPGSAPPRSEAAAVMDEFGGVGALLRFTLE